MTSKNISSTDQEIFLGNRFHSLQGLLLMPCNKHVDRTREDIKEDKTKEHNGGLHNDHNHRKDDEDEDAERFSFGQIEFFKTEVPDV